MTEPIPKTSPKHLRHNRDVLSTKKLAGGGSPEFFPLDRPEAPPVHGGYVLTPFTQRTRTAGLLSSRRMLAGLLLIGVASLGLMGLGATSASAATATPTTACVANATTGCIQGTIKQGNGDPAVGVKLTVTTGDTTENLVTDAAGKWGVAITVEGPSTVTLDTTSLPSGNTLDPSIANPATVNGGLGRNALTGPGLRDRERGRRDAR